MCRVLVSTMISLVLSLPSISIALDIPSYSAIEFAIFEGEEAL